MTVTSDLAMLVLDIKKSSTRRKIPLLKRLFTSGLKERGRGRGRGGVKI